MGLAELLELPPHAAMTSPALERLAEVRAIDFGCARHTEELKACRRPMGTPVYMAPGEAATRAGAPPPPWYSCGAAM